MSGEEAARRAAGRRRYNSIRSLEKDLRRRDVLSYIEAHGLGYGVQARIARELGVSEATISRDVAALLYDVHPCPTCHRVWGREDWEEVAEAGRVKLTERGVEIVCS